MALIVADSDVLIDALKGQEPVATRIRDEITAGRLATTAVSRYEVLSGARTEKEERRTRDLLDILTTLPLDVAAADRAVGVRRTLEKAGQTIGMADSLIAGTVLRNGGTLLTRNRREFERVEGLSLEALS